jgi:phage replication-related protein YjqB (UPF0714/DUF867 family)
VSARGGARAGTLEALWNTGISPRPISTRQASPLLNSIIFRGFRYAVAFHGFDNPNIPHDILVGGLAPDALKKNVKEAIEGVVGSDFTVHITKPDEQFGGDDKRNIVNRLTVGGANGIQIEQKIGPREKYAQPIADAVANRFLARI